MRCNKQSSRTLCAHVMMIAIVCFCFGSASTLLHRRNVASPTKRQRQLGTGIRKWQCRTAVGAVGSSCVLTAGESWPSRGRNDKSHVRKLGHASRLTSVARCAPAHHSQPLRPFTESVPPHCPRHSGSSHESGPARLRPRKRGGKVGTFTPEYGWHRTNRPWRAGDTGRAADPGRPRRAGARRRG